MDDLMPPNPLESDNLIGTSALHSLTIAINSLNQRIDRTETDFVHHWGKVEDKLEQIVELTKTVAVIQNQASTQNEQMIELRTQVREGQAKVEGSVTRIHQRLDDISTNQRTALDMMEKGTDLKINALETKHDVLAADYHKWFNRGWGAWFLMAAVLSGVGWAANRWIDSIDRDKIELVSAVAKLKTDSEKQAAKQEAVDASIRELLSATRKLVDSQRDLEDLVTRRSLVK